MWAIIIRSPVISRRSSLSVSRSLGIASQRWSFAFASAAIARSLLLGAAKLRAGALPVNSPGSGADPAGQHPHAAQGDPAVRPCHRVESARLAGKNPRPHLGLRRQRSAAIEPFVEVELEGLLDQLD